MKNLIQDIKKNSLFSAVSDKELEFILSKRDYEKKSYHKNQTIAIRSQLCDKIGIIVSGALVVQHISFEGQLTDITTLKAGDCFGEALLFGSLNSYPYNLTALEDLTIVYFHKTNISYLLQNNIDFSISYLKTLSNKIAVLQEKLFIVTQKSLRNKILLFLLKEYQRQKSFSFKIPLTITDLASYIGSTRPSVSRELSNMQKDKIINIKKRNIQILKPQIFETL